MSSFPSHNNNIPEGKSIISIILPRPQISVHCPRIYVCVGITSVHVKKKRKTKRNETFPISILPENDFRVSIKLDFYWTRITISCVDRKIKHGVQTWIYRVQQKNRRSPPTVRGTFYILKSNRFEQKFNIPFLHFISTTR